MEEKFDIAGIDEIAPGTWKIVSVKGREIGVYNKNGQYYAIRNMCPHQQAELCKGAVSGTNLPSEPHEYKYGMEEGVLSCPWHGWEFSLETGKSLHDPEACRVKTYTVEIENQRIILCV